MASRFENVPSFAILRSFESAARLGSFSRAAEELGLTQSAIGRQVRELETAIGTPLFRRIGRGVAPTPAGTALAASVAKDLDRVRQTIIRAKVAGASDNVLHIASLSTFGSRWLMPRLPDFCRRHPEILINLLTRNERFDLAEEGIDVAIHYGIADWPDAKIDNLCGEKLMAVCTPEFGERHGIDSLECLLRVPLLHLTSRPDLWTNWFLSNGISGSRSAPGMLLDQFVAMIAATLAGLGVALLPTYLIEKELADGDLIPLSEKTTLTDRRYFVVSQLGRPSRNVRSFVRWIQSQTSKAPL